MAARMLRKLTAAALLVGASIGLATQAWARPKPGVRVVRPTPTRRTFNLFAGAPQADYRPNRVQCGIINNGTACTDPSGSPVNENGFWPAGSPDNYVFNSGLQIAGFIPANAGFAWAGDTVGAYFFDPRGDQHHGEGLSNIYDQRNPDDLANWPTAGDITDTALFAPTLLGRHTASQEDLWYRYWDGNTSLQAGRKHTMGLLVDQRFMGWNYPAGNNDILYTIVRFINITSGNRADYDNLADFGYSTADIDAIYQIALNFRATSQAFYNVTIPQGGFPWVNVYASYAGDFDEGDANHNLSMGNLIFNTVMNYKSDFVEPTWQLPPSIFSAPFLAGPGMAAIKYLQTPGNLGISMMGNTTNGAGFPDAQGIPQLWRHLSGDVITADGVSCNIPGGVNTAIAKARRQCYWQPNSFDTRIYGASGPFTVNPGHAAGTAVAIVFAASVAKLPAATPGVVTNAQIPAGDVQTNQAAGNDFPNSHLSGARYGVDGTRLLANEDTLAPIDRIMGFVNYTTDVNGNGKIDQAEVITVPRSLLDKEKVAQTVYDNKFLLPFAPEAPAFYAVPGDGEVTVVWQKSGSEATGNPFYAIASQPLLNGVPNALYDPNFRQFDVEGYRVWRGRTSSDMAVVAQFDYAGTTMLDYTAEFFDETFSGNACAPELGIQTTCADENGNPVTYTQDPGTGAWIADHPVNVKLSGVVRQIPPGGRVALANGTVFNVTVDTAVTGGATGYPALSDNGVPFVYSDNSVVNGVRYFYAVTAFSINSLKSGPSSLESPIVPKTATPRAASANAVSSAVFTSDLVGSDGTVLDQAAAFPTVNANGTLAGPVPPTNVGSLAFLAYLPQVLPAGDFYASVDSLSAGFTGGFGTAPTAYFTFSSGVDTVHFHTSVQVPEPTFNNSVNTNGTFATNSPLVPYDTGLARGLGISPTFQSRMPVELSGLKSISLAATGAAVSIANGRYGASGTNVGGRYLAHSYFYDGATPPANPSITPFPDAAHNSGKLTGVDTIYNLQAYRSPTDAAGTAQNAISVNFRGVNAAGAVVWYPADYTMTWGAGGAITVRDSTHHVTVPFNKTMGTGYGFVNLDSLVAYGVTADANGATSVQDGVGNPTMTALAYQHLYAIYPACTNDWWATPSVCTPLSPKAVLQPIDVNSDGVSEGNGFIMVINGEFFMMKMAALPASGTVWHLTAWGGGSATATCTPAVTGTISTHAAAPTSCTYSAYTPPATRPAFAPGIRYRIHITNAQTFNPAQVVTLDNVHTVPDPYYVTNSLEQTANTKILRFVNLPSQAIIRVYSASGILVRILTHDDPAGGGEEVWDLRNRNNQFVASGVYFFNVEAPDGKTKVGRFTVVSFAQ